MEALQLPSCGCFGREGMLTSSARGVVLFLKELWLPWAHTRTGEEASAGITSLAVPDFTRGEGEARVAVHSQVTTSEFYLMPL